MRVVCFEDFCNLPDGTIFSFWEPCVAEGLYRREEVLYDDSGHRIDFWMMSLIAESDAHGSGPAVCVDQFRWGMYEYDQKFAIYEKEDLGKLAWALGFPGIES